MGYRRPGERRGPGRYGEPAEFGRIGAGWGYRWRPEGAETPIPREVPAFGPYAGGYRRGRGAVEGAGRWAAPYPPYPRYSSDYGAYTGTYGVYGEYGSDYGDDIGEYRPMGAVGENQERMGMRDFTERYGRYSGGSPYSYEYSERTVIQPSRFPAMRGFSRSFGRSRYRRGR